MKVEKLNKFSFKFEDIDLIYPVYIRDKKNQAKSHNFKRSVVSGIRSRKYQLDNRSTQAIIFDKLIELDYFKLLNLNFNFILELPLINTRPDIDSTRSYYLLDYFIPNLSLAIELDSDYHDPIKDKLKDQFLNSIGIDVVRIDNFQIDTKSKLESLVEYIREKKEMKFELSYEELIEYSKIKSLDNTDLDIYNSYGMVLDDNLGIKNKWKSAIMKLGNYDPNFMNAVLTKSNYSLDITLNDLYNLIPMSRKAADKYISLMNYMKTLHILISIN